MNQEAVMKIFEEQGAFHKGHFKLSSGLHSEYYLQCALVLADPAIAAKLCKELGGKFKGEKIDVVIGPAVGGITAAYEVARALGVRGIFSERAEGKMALRRGFKLKPGEKVLVIEDVATTGGSAQEVVDLVKGLGAEAVGVGAIIDRSGGKAKFSVPFKSLAQLKIETFQPEDCPLCKAGKPVIKPGSRK
ncbi:MAG: orotate phosphoribosyltransferase [Candidatus Omnitrophica bacterium]|nr:orotate phosphoribosyltransferase [Candidatus Omnitrophota bacterium]MDD5310222.1 orotate phosphoribosyltransferase [Candidatus Omnitrophota bacterium]MDD5546200.1 orotate phosphoribosyltransferase [Candidatus Omnitrophota bacterium]